MTTVAEVLLRRAEDDNVGLRSVEDPASWTWRSVVRECAVRAAVLEALCREDRPFHLGVLLDNVPEFVFLLGGAALTGATVVGINPTRRGEELAADIRHTDCQLVVTESRQAGLLAGLELGLPADRILEVEDDRWSALLAAHAGAEVPDQLPQESTLFLLIFTSGSSGTPKAVRATQGRIASLTDMGFGPDDVLYCAMPLFHGNALVANLMPGIGGGATVVLRRRFSASGFLPDLRRFGVTYFNSVGRALSYVLATPASAGDRDHSVRFGLAPETSPRDITAFQERFGIPVIEGYGSSEGALRLLPVPNAPPGALGRPDPGVDVAVVDAAGRECPTAELDGDGRLLNGDAAIGELVRRDAGAAAFEGYYNNPVATAERTRNGWFWSGDLAYRNASGMFFFAGRTIDWLRVDGENFAAAPVERILGRHLDVTGAAVYAVPDPRTGDQVMAALELAVGAAFDPAAFAEFLAAQPDLGPKWWPRFVRITTPLPTTATNKVAKAELRAEAWLTRDPVWWRPITPSPPAPDTGTGTTGTSSAPGTTTSTSTAADLGTGLRFVPFTEADADELAAQFAEFGRLRLLPG